MPGAFGNRNGQTHGLWHRPEYNTWNRIKDRCLNPRSKPYPHYGGRGIGICPEWATSFAAFLNHIGPRPSAAHTVERINNDLGYEPGNVRWATRKEQMQNTRANHILTLGDRSMPLSAWAETLGLARSTLIRRIKTGRPLDLILSPHRLFKRTKQQFRREAEKANPR